MKILYYSRARTALRIGLQLLECKQGDIILIPDFLCNVLWHPIELLGLKVITYSVDNNLNPEWDEIEEIEFRENIFALLMVHYFGQPQNIEKYKEFCNEKQIYLIENNAHGHGGTYNGKTLGTFGDIGFSSPRKFVNKSYGGYLYLHNEKLEKLPALKKSPDTMYCFFEDSLKSFISRSPIVFSYLKSMKFRNVDWYNPRFFQEEIKSDYILSDTNKAKIDNIDWEQVALKRRKLWKEWKALADVNDLEPVFPELHAESSPLAFPVYAQDIKHRNHWLKWGTRHGIPAFSWPALPDTVIKKMGSALKRWERMLCFPLDGVSAKRFI